MHIFFLSISVFALAYMTNTFYITVLYHRGLAHGAVHLNKVSYWLVAYTGIWMTGIDPKAWACMHRRHHQFSDTQLDPHSPVHQGVIGVALGQLRSYENVLRGLIRRRPEMMKAVSDIQFPVNFLNRKGLWFLPYVLHTLIGVGIGLLTQSYWVGILYYIGIMSHPVQGWMVNALAHRFGYRNFNLQDNSKNNTLVSWLVFGEGLQNNHHARPKSANFAKAAGEIDLGFVMCKIAGVLRLIRLRPCASESRT
jgi:stearoyl-CoA desaturase (delta-9 desaturase)